MDISANLSHVCPRGYCPDFVPLYSWPTLADLYGCMCLWNHTLSFLVKNMSVVHYYIGPVHTVSYHQVSWSALLDLFCTNCVNSLPVSRAPNHFRNSGALPLFLLEESESKFSSSAILPRAKKVSALVILSDSPGTIRQNYSSSTECPWLVHCYNLYSFFHIVGHFFLHQQILFIFILVVPTRPWLEDIYQIPTVHMPKYWMGLSVMKLNVHKGNHHHRSELKDIQERRRPIFIWMIPQQTDYYLTLYYSYQKSKWNMEQYTMRKEINKHMKWKQCLLCLIDLSYCSVTWSFGSLREPWDHSVVL